MTSILGKILIISLIIFYTSVHKVYGVLFCLLVILFYQLDIVKWVSEGFCDTSGLYIPDNPKENECGCNKCGKCRKQPNTVPRPGQQDYLTVIDLEDNIRERNKTEFQKRHCTFDGVLTYKDIPVKKDMSDIVFTEVEYEDDTNICNLCDPNCKFRVLKNQEEWPKATT